MKKLSMQALIPLLVFISLVGLLAVGLKRDPAYSANNLINTPMPSFAIDPLFANDLVFSNKTFKNKVALLNIWASWCGSCRREHETLMNIANEKVIPIYGIVYEDRRNNAIALLKSTGDPYQKVGLDLDGTTAIALGVYGTPETFLIDKQGIIRYKHIGPLTENIWNQEIKPLAHSLLEMS